MDNNQFEQDQTPVNEPVNDASAANDAPAYEPVIVEEKKEGFDVLGLVAMICGILAILLGCCCYFVAWIPALVAIILPFLSKAKRGKLSVFGIVGLICGIVGMLIVIVCVGVALLGIVVSESSSSSSYYYY